jgi:hypothetical protein
MRKPTLIAAAMVLGAAGLAITTNAGTAFAASSRRLVSGGTVALVANPSSDGAGLSDVEFASEPPREDDGSVSGDEGAARGGEARRVRGLDVKAAGGEVAVSFNGLNFRQQRFANGGNQFSVEPPDQGLCVGNGFVLESVNDVLRVFDGSGNPLSGVVDLNTFYGYAPAIDRAHGNVRGPFVTDPTCYYDPDVQRWFHVVLTLEVNPRNGAFLGPNHLDLAVSTSPSPLGTWQIYRLPVQDDGTQGTPNHGCSGPGGRTGPCIGDYPHVGADANGFYMTTNEYSFLGAGEFHGAQIYAVSKAQLAAGNPSPLVIQFDTATDAPTNGFTVWPATAPVGGNELKRGGTEYMMSGLVSNQAAPPPETPFGSANRVMVWAVTNTSSLDSASPSLKLSSTSAEVGRYSTPPKATQKAGDFPLGQCINDTSLPTPFGPGCWQNLFLAEPAHNEVLSPLDANDGRMQQVTFFKGKLYGALDTKVRVGGGEDGRDVATSEARSSGKGEERAGIEWFIVRPKMDDRKLEAETRRSGYVAVAGNDAIYPAIGVSSSGKAIMAFTLTGNDNYPSAAYAQLREEDDNATVRVIAAGAGPQDGFSGYNSFAASGVARPRWGDYGASAVVGDTVWLASEFIAQTCTLAQYVDSPFGSCGGTRATLGNWATRVSAINL